MGTAVETPAVEYNPPAQPSISYRAGTWSSFKSSMLARLSSSDYPALAGLRTRDDDDFTIALLDASAVMLDVLTFYQERLANESYLRTAQQLRSATELSRLIGYRPAPGVGAQAYVAFTLKAAPGQPDDPTAAPITIPAGTQVQSVPAQGQLPQTFETSAAIQATADWSALPVLADSVWIPQLGDPGVFLAGTATQLQPGDAILIVGDERLQSPTDPHWDVRTVTSVDADTVQNRTYIGFDRPLGYSGPGASVSPTQSNPKVYALRQKAAFFGSSAPDPNLFVNPTSTAGGGTPTTSFPNLIDTSTTPWKWIGYKVPGSPVYLDAPYPKVVAGTSSWVALTVPAQSAIGALEAEITSLGAVSDELNAVITPVEKLASLETHLSAAKTFEEDVAHDYQQQPISIKSQLHNLSLKLADLGAEFALMEADLHSLNASQVVTDLKQMQSTLAERIADLKAESTRLNLTAAPSVALYQVQSAAQVSQSAFSVTAKVTVLQLNPSSVDGSTYGIRDTVVLAQSEELPVASQPLAYPLYGSLLDLEELRPDLAGVQVVAIFGKRQKVTVLANSLTFVPDDQSEPSGEILAIGAVLTLTDPTTLIALSPSGGWANWSSGTTTVELSVEDAAGRTGTIANALLSQFALTPSAPTDPDVSEYALVSSILGQEVLAQDSGVPHTQIQLQSPLANCYDRTATTVNANTGLATQGQSVSEIMGSGDASETDQTFTLKQSPLTFIQAATTSGMASTLQVMVNGVAWTEVPSLFEQGPSQPVFATLNQSDQTTDVLFGDGVEGSVLPTGQNNISANYRIGSGSAGNVAADSITTLMDRPLGVSGVTNPEPATGGEDPETTGDISANAPVTVLTLGRAVSILDYQNFAITFAGIAKAYALWVPSGPGRGVFLTVAGTGGTVFESGDATIANLTTALQSYGNPLIPISVVSYVETTFGLDAAVCYDTSYVQAAVKAAINQALSQAFAFAVRDFGQAVTTDEVAAVIQAVPGVVGVNVTSIFTVSTSSGGNIAAWGQGLTIAQYRAWITRLGARPSSGMDCADQIQSFLPVASSQSVPQPAEIVVLDPNPINVQLTVMP
jgi:hypothetical protein